MNEEIIAGEELSSLLPHKGKMVLLSRVKAYNKESPSLSAEYDVGPDCLFFDPAIKGIPSWVGVECMAQGISALSGIFNRDEGRQPQPGFILSVSNLELSVPFLRSGTVLRIHVQEDCRLNEVFTYNCRLSLLQKTETGEASGPFPVGEAKLTVMEADDISLWEGK
jgi:predicted hotdog family 3-hydroxylacyl-ACP dehydratase